MDRCLSLLGLLAVAVGAAVFVSNLIPDRQPHTDPEPLPLPLGRIHLFHAAFSLN